LYMMKESYKIYIDREQGGYMGNYPIT